MHKIHHTVVQVGDEIDESATGIKFGTNGSAAWPFYSQVDIPLHSSPRFC